jgi:outer membrane protein OmpA-like peptidoglycan-associated protein
MKKVLLVIIAFASCTPGWGADKDLLTPEPQRITDQAIAADIKTMQGVQKRLAELNKKGVPIASYHFAKAQAWLDFALDAYTMNDRSTVMEEALRQAVGIIGQLEAGKKDIGMGTPTLPSSSLVRPDLWARAEKLKKHANFRCAEDKVAQLEVQLVWAGHEDKEMGWRHAKPYLQAAERLAREAGAQIASCPPEPQDTPALAGKTVPSRPAMAAAPVAASQPILADAVKMPTEAAVMSVKCDPSVPAAIVKALAPLPDRIHFAFNRAEISTASFSVITRIAVAMNSEPTLRLVLYGHADQRGDLNYNMNLSRQRAENVRSSLVSAGIGVDRIVIAPIGKIQPLTTGKSAEAYARNRRVEFFFTMGPPQPVIPNMEDLQPEKR